MAENFSVQLLARRVKKLALEEAELILSRQKKVSKEVYNETYLAVLKNAVPRSTEISTDPENLPTFILQSYANTQGPVPTESVPDTTPPSV